VTRSTRVVVTVRVRDVVVAAVLVVAVDVGVGARGTAGAGRNLGIAICGKRATGNVSAGIDTGTAGASTCVRTTAVNSTAYGSASASSPAMPNQYSCRRVPRLPSPNARFAPEAPAYAGVSTLLM